MEVYQMSSKTEEKGWKDYSHSRHRLRKFQSKHHMDSHIWLCPHLTGPRICSWSLQSLDVRLPFLRDPMRVDV
jgi:hypothetical protein